MGGGGGTNTTTQKSDPWAGIAPYLTGQGGLFSQAQNLYGQGQTPSQYTTDYQQGIAGAVPGAQANIGSAQEWAKGAMGSPGFQSGALGDIAGGGGVSGDFYKNLVGGGGLGGSPASQYLTGIAGGQVNPASDLYGSFARGENIGVNPAFDLLGGTARGEMLNKNPYVDEMFGRASGRVGKAFQESVLPGLQSQFAGAGRYGSPAQAGQESQARTDLGETLGGLASDIYGRNYAQERQNMLRAGETLGGIGMQERGQQLQGISGLGGLSQADIGNRLAATGQLGQAYTGERGRQIGAAGALQGGQLAGIGGLQDAYNRMMGIQGQGAEMLPGLNQAGFGALSQLGSIGQQQQQQPWQNLQNLASQFRGWGGGTSTSESPNQYNPLMDLLGMGLQAGGTYAGLKA